MGSGIRDHKLCAVLVAISASHSFQQNEILFLHLRFCLFTLKCWFLITFTYSFTNYLFWIFVLTNFLSL